MAPPEHWFRAAVACCVRASLERASATWNCGSTAKLNNVGPQTRLADVFGRIAGTPQTQLGELLPWNWKDGRRHDQAA